MITRALMKVKLPQFRQRNEIIIVNIKSSVVLKPFPLHSVYTASKAAITAFTESLALELHPFNIRVSLVEPGRSPETRFGENAKPLRSEEHTSELQSRGHLVCRLLLEKQNNRII